MKLLSKIIAGTMIFVSVSCFSQTSTDFSVADVRLFLEENLDSLILFYRPNCPYCQYVLPLFDEVQQKYEGVVAFLKVDINFDATFKSAFSFATVPTLIYFKDGIEQFRQGSNNMTLKTTDIEANIEEYIL